MKTIGEKITNTNPFGHKSAGTIRGHTEDGGYLVEWDEPSLKVTLSKYIRETFKVQVKGSELDRIIEIVQEFNPEIPQGPDHTAPTIL